MSAARTVDDDVRDFGNGFTVNGQRVDPSAVTIHRASPNAVQVDVLAVLDGCVEEAQFRGHQAEIIAARAAVVELIVERDRLDAMINNPQTGMFLEAVRSEAAHQVERWGTVHDRAKAPQDWFWLLGYLGGKALAAHNAGDEFKALHHTVSSAAVLANWFAAIKLGKSDMAPGSSDLQAFLDAQFGPGSLAGIGSAP